MKPINIAILLVFAGFHAAAQGTVRFENNIPGELVTHVYTFPWGPMSGNGPSDEPPGSRDWSGYIAAAGLSYSAQLLAAPGADIRWGQLKPASPVTSFQTGENAGFLVPLIATLDGVPTDAPVATVAMVAWDNQNGTVNTWEEAFYAPQSWWGVFGEFNVYDIGGAANPPPILRGLQSFGMGEYISIPEPSGLAIMGLGFSMFSLMRRWRSRKQA